MSTGEDWYKIMFDTSRTKDCVDSCGSGTLINIRIFNIVFHNLQYYCSVCYAEFVYFGNHVKL